MRSHTKVLGAALLAAIVMTAILVVTASGGSEPQAKPATPQKTSAVKPVSNRQAFAVLARPSSKASRKRIRAARARTLRLDSNAIREARSGVLVGPTTDGEVCLMNGPASSCGPNAYAQTVGLVLIVQCDHGNPGVKRSTTVLVPDGAPAPTLKDDGREVKTLDVVNNVAYTEDTTADSITQANGTTLELPPLNC